VIICPASSARWRSSPTRKSSPANCAAAIPVSSAPAPKPRSRCLMGTTAPSSPPATPSRPHNPVTAARLAFAAGLTITWQRSSQAKVAPICIYRGESPAYSESGLTRDDYFILAARGPRPGRAVPGQPARGRGRLACSTGEEPFCFFHLVRVLLVRAVHESVSCEALEPRVPQI
jgi:hypothetical protein